MNVATKVLANWDEIHQYLRPGWLYRGQSNADWPLKTSFDRCCEREAFPAGDRRRIEKALHREFRRAYHQYSRSVPAPGAILEWFSLMQHHGAPTRLLDFTYSLYTAAYFAVETTNVNAAVWAVNFRWAVQTARQRFLDAGKDEDR
jgi:hypothetical protein